MLSDKKKDQFSDLTLPRGFPHNSTDKRLCLTRYSKEVYSALNLLPSFSPNRQVNIFSDVLGVNQAPSTTMAEPFGTRQDAPAYYS